MRCHHFAAKRCQSCNWLDVGYSEQVEAKQRQVRELLGEQPDLVWAEPVLSAEFGFRNKAKMVVSGTVDAPILGILDGVGAGVDLQDCPLYPAELSAAFAPLAE